MEGAFLGSIIFEFIGAFFRWLLLFTLNKIKGRKSVSFKQVWEGRKNTSLQENVEHGFSNIVLGVIIVIGTIVILKLVGI